jgi:hypothetical protein
MGYGTHRNSEKGRTPENIARLSPLQLSDRRIMTSRASTVRSQDHGVTGFSCQIAGSWRHGPGPLPPTSPGHLGRTLSVSWCFFFKVLTALWTVTLIRIRIRNDPQPYFKYIFHENNQLFVTFKSN